MQDRTTADTLPTGTCEFFCRTQHDYEVSATDRGLLPSTSLMLAESMTVLQLPIGLNPCISDISLWSFAINFRFGWPINPF